MRGGRRPGGFTLLEVVVAATLLEVGLAAVAGLLAVGARHLARARSAEWAVAAAAQVADSLARDGAAGEGGRVLPGGRVRWTVAPGTAPGLAVVHIQADRTGAGRPVRIRAVLPSAGTGASP